MLAIWPRIRKLKQVAFWLCMATGLAAVLVMIVSTSRHPHVTQTIGRADGDNYIVECTLVNPTTLPVRIIATSSITHESTNRHHSLVAYPKIQQSVSLDPQETKTLKFAHPCNTPAHRIHQTVILRPDNQ